MRTRLPRHGGHGQMTTSASRRRRDEALSRNDLPSPRAGVLVAMWRLDDRSAARPWASDRQLPHIDLLFFHRQGDPSTCDRDVHRSCTCCWSSVVDVREVADCRGVAVSTRPAESSYRPAAVGRPYAQPQNACVEGVVLYGLDVKELCGRTPDSCLPYVRYAPTHATGHHRPADTDGPGSSAGRASAASGP